MEADSKRRGAAAGGAAVVMSDAARVRRQQQVALLQVLGNERRLRVLEALAQGEHSVGALVTAIGLPQNQVSTALSQFAAIGLVRRRRDGRRVFYTLADASVAAFMAQIAGLARVLASVVTPGARDGIDAALDLGGGAVPTD